MMVILKKAIPQRWRRPLAGKQDSAQIIVPLLLQTQHRCRGIWMILDIMLLV
jgi:hypothetical protein